MSWVGHRLMPRIIPDNQYLFQQGESIMELYFLQRGKLNYVLPKYTNKSYHTMHRGDIFGMEDILFNFQLIREELDVENIPERNMLGQRRFTVFSNIVCEALFFSVEDLKMMGFEFPKTATFMKDMSDK